MKPYPVKIEEMLQQFYTILSEEDERHYVAIETRKLERGGVSYTAAGNPMISIDTKKKGYLGNFYLDGCLCTTEEIQIHDQDFTNFAEDVIIPHTIYDLQRNTGHLHLGTSQDTSAFACDCLRNWWYNQGCFDYPDIAFILVLRDDGGSNKSCYCIFK